MEAKSEFSSQLVHHLLSQTPLCPDIFGIISDYSWAPPGTFLFKWSTRKERSKVHSFNAITFHPIRRLVFVSKYILNCIQVFAPDGSFINQWGSKGDGDGQFNSLYSIAVHPAADLIFVADTGNRRVQVFQSNGTFVRKWRLDHFYPSGITVDPDANLVYARRSCRRAYDRIYC